MKNLLLLACLLSVGCTVNNNTTNDGGTSGGDDTGTAPGTDGSTSDSPGSDDGTGTETSVTDDSGTPPSDGGTMETGTGGLATSCSTGSLFAGNPLYKGMPLDRPTSGTGILADPPFQWENLVFANGWLFSRDEGELWGVDLSASAKVEKRVAGLNRTDANFGFSDGPCASARFSRIEGLAMLPDKSLVVADSLANAILHVKNPTTSACTVEYWAGNHTASLDYDPFMSPPNEGDVNGPGAMAKLNSPGAIVADEAGNVYFYDYGSHNIKKVSNEAAHTVSTLVAVPKSGAVDKIPNLTRIGGKIYGAGFDSSNKSYVIEVDIATGTLKNIVESAGGSKFDPADSAGSVQLSGITTDGTGLIVSGDGYVWYVTTAGVVTHIAGQGPNIDYWPSDYDPKASHPAKDLWLPPVRSASSIGSADYITYFEGSLYFRAQGDGTAAFIEKISCP
jgi:hypothetical protein